mmetsp:Transcript_12867/g.21161  ORF Transcript_12867/g.21161 Transcript_12867/m.21161 type:complete len:735 (-) Transcript_12867:3937-6141(-)
MDDIVDSAYQPPDPNVDDPDEVALYVKKNTLLFISLLDSIATNEGSVIIKKHSRTSDGTAAWLELTNFYDKDMSAVTRTKYIFDLICGSTIPRNHKGLAAAIDKFRGWVMEHNHFCKSGEAIVGIQELIYLERYISSIDELVKTKELMDVQEDSGIGTQAVQRTPEAKMAFYYRQAQLIDAKNKTALIKKRMINASISGSIPTVDEVSLWDADSTDTSSVTINSTMMELISDVEASYEVYAARGRRHGQMPNEAFQKLSKNEKAAWLLISQDNRENIVTSLSKSMDEKVRPTPPTTNEDPRIPSAGISSHRARTANVSIADENGEMPNVPNEENTSDRDMNLSIIGPMQARSIAASNGIKSKPPFVPGRFLSAQNASPHDLVPILRTPNTTTPSNENQRKSYMAWSTTVKETLYDAAFPDLLGEIQPEVRSAYMARAISSTSYGRPILTHLALIDSGANNGLANSKQLRRLNYSVPRRYIKVTGIGESDDRSIRIGTFAGKVTTEMGREVILILHEFGECFEGPTIMSKLQMLDGGCDICDTPITLGGRQHLIPLQDARQNITIPISFQDGLPFVEMTYPTDEDMLTLPMVSATSSDRWNPCVYDSNMPTSNLRDEIRRRTNLAIENNLLAFDQNLPRYDIPSHIADEMSRLSYRNDANPSRSTNPFDVQDEDEYERINYIDDIVYMNVTNRGGDPANVDLRSLPRNLVERFIQDHHRELYLDMNPQEALHYVD